MKNNKGFSLVELIIVIAIMAILVGVMAPQLIKYIEKTNVSSDTQLCDSVKSAVTTAIMDPAVINATSNGIPADNTDTTVASLNSTTEAFDLAVQETLGMDSTSIGNINGKIKSAHATTSAITFSIKGANSVHVWIPGTDASGKKTTSYTYANLADTNSSNDIIFVD